jgi:hypothetical protein
MKKTILILMAVTLLIIMSTMSLYSQDKGGNFCVIHFVYDSLNYGRGGDIDVKASGTVAVDNGSGQITNIKCASLAKFIDDMKSKGWTLSTTMPLTTQLGVVGYTFIFEKKK